MPTVHAKAWPACQRWLADHLEAQVYICDRQLKAVEHDAAQLPTQCPEAPAIRLAAAAAAFADSCCCGAAVCWAAWLGVLLHLQRRQLSTLCCLPDTAGCQTVSLVFVRQQRMCMQELRLSMASVFGLRFSMQPRTHLCSSSSWALLPVRLLTRPDADGHVGQRNLQKAPCEGMPWHLHACACVRSSSRCLN